MLSREILPERWTEIKHADFKYVLDHIIAQILTEETNFFESFSVKQEFCWSVMVNCCSKIPISQEDLTWAHFYQPFIKDLCQVFLRTRRKKLIPEVLIPKLPKKILNHPAPKVQKYVSLATSYWVKVTSCVDIILT